jgi:hypothetical protein
VLRYAAHAHLHHTARSFTDDATPLLTDDAAPLLTDDVTGSFTEDLAAPVLLGFGLDVDGAKLSLTFDEVIDAATVDPTLFTIQATKGTVRVFRQKSTLEDAIGSHACSLEASRRVTNGIPLGSSLFLPVHTVNCVQTLKVVQPTVGQTLHGARFPP